MMWPPTWPKAIRIFLTTIVSLVLAPVVGLLLVMVGGWGAFSSGGGLIFPVIILWGIVAVFAVPYLAYKADREMYRD